MVSVDAEEENLASEKSLGKGQQPAWWDMALESTFGAVVQKLDQECGIQNLAIL